ncbi:MAG: glycine--tRNA ligase subunit beta, partial [Coriobacteriales bacterium]|nr:glycine--tRNA ligase subunit beta [Coriobacteriales bacterium]
MSRDLLFELGTEELPSSHLYGAIEQLTVSVPKALDDARLEYAEVTVQGTPRRLAVRVSELAERQDDRTERAKGPAIKAAFDADGNPTKAAEGFARGKGVSVEDLIKVDDENGAYVYAIVELPGRDATEVLPALLARLAGEIEWPKAQRWGRGDMRFSRPVRWIVAMFGGEVLPVSYAGLEASDTTEGHRFLARGPYRLPIASEYAVAMERGKVIVDHHERARLIREGIEVEAGKLDARAVVPEKVFAEVVNLVEWPTVTVGTFDEDFLAVPREVLENAMESHQRYFPVETAEGEFTNRFIVVHNGDPACSEQIVRGHERVIRARLADAAFFYHEDLSHPLEAYVDRLCSITFQEKLGTLYDKAERIEKLAGRLGETLGAPADEIAFAQRAAHLAKADLVTSAVVEFTSRQGVMGGYYATAAGEEPEVATAIVEHYQPRFAGDALPSTIAARLVAVADKMDTIVGIFAAG